MKNQEHIRSSQQSMTIQFWFKIYTQDPYCIYFFGPFASQEHANQELQPYLVQLEAQGRHIVCCFDYTPSTGEDTLDSCSMTHKYWLQSLMEDQLHKKVAYTHEKGSKLLEHHTTHDAYLD